ncbi:hypothetical protein MCOR27_007700 [Pyricularia oryzae]|uniref:SGNH hydrolase-type esterase domain-containing protein n=2 Tax=Pyricularia TaxID=48558 RepID=A0ABQ8NME0_PYRGI|nr:hypothetical protein MCOR01_000303 [Pyricularia oryzae]KAI6299337.1 hypothetical protein MCOR33_004753 [Pyricularia grisea]KAH9427981.1 hypothetical protein MCOR02_011475 [Pyricularia oryzae]KAI6256029.1 hypothetical protein MCOR19_007514 [Pyricularia oryzae]KAI6273125.1 hypothetical protein MCOR26_007044 [Pyricularia oryzae]
MQLPTSLFAGALGALLLPQQVLATIYLCGDSTMARSGANDGQTDGWGNHFQKYTTAPVVNKAIGGRSARSYWNEGRFAEVANLVRAGDVVVIEFGHNDGGSPNKNDNGRSDCPGSGTEVCYSDKTGEAVYTFVFYYIQAAKLMLAKGATVVLSSQTPNNLWEGGQYGSGAPRFVGYVATAQRALADSRVTQVDHFTATARMYLKLGNAATNALYPRDHTHTSVKGADLNAQSFAQAVAQGLNGTTSLKNLIISNYPRVY